MTRTPPPLETTPFGTTPDGRHVRLFTIRNNQGLELKLSEYGATVTSLCVPDRDGRIENITLGFSDFQSWLQNPCYFGATVGRYGNRIADGKFTLNETDYQLANNNELHGFPSHLHGGIEGFDQKVWNGQPVIRPDATGVCFTYYSDDGEEGYPGNLTVKVTYWLTKSNEMEFRVEATTDAPTPINIINHTYWNLTGNPKQDILGHELQLMADAFLPTNPGLIPAGEEAPVTNTPMDFTRASTIGERIEQDFEPLKIAGGYDHCWVIRDDHGKELRTAAILHDPVSGRVMQIVTDQPGLQFYAGNFLPDKRTALCLETQKFPDSPNQPQFPDCILKPGETYKHTCLFRFSTR